MRRGARTEPPKGVILDFDGLCYKFEPDFPEVCLRAGAQAARALGLKESEAEFCTRFAGVRDSTLIAAELHRAHGIDPAEFSHRFHDAIDLEKCIAREQEAAPVFRELAARRIPIAILTHANFNWVKRTLPHIGMGGLIPDALIFSIERTNGVRKPDSPEPVRMVADALGLPLQSLAMLEDSAANLVHAHAEGVATGFLHYGSPLRPRPPHVHVQAASVSRLVKGLGL